MRTPINYAAGLFIVVVVGALLALLFGYAVVNAAVRRARWPREWRRRRALRPVVANVDRCERITDAGHCDLVISFAPADAMNYRDGRGARLRATTRLPESAFARIAQNKTLPVRVAADAPASVVVDFEALLAGEAESFARDVYVERGSTRWRSA